MADSCFGVSHHATPESNQLFYLAEDWPFDFIILYVNFMCSLRMAKFQKTRLRYFFTKFLTIIILKLFFNELVAMLCRVFQRDLGNITVLFFLPVELTNRNLNVQK
jgi:hypothetical protein